MLPLQLSALLALASPSAVARVPVPTVPLSAALQDAPGRPWPLTAAPEAFARLGNAGYLAGVLALLEREEEARASASLRPLYLDVLGALWAQVGEEQRATRAGDEAYPREQATPPTPDAPAELVRSHRPTPAVEAIVAAARERRLVMVNEEHRSSRQRAFAHRLLAPLRELGFTHLALETLSEDPEALAARGHPRLGSGTYTVDPVLGDLVRRALELGYVVVGYEAGPQAMAPRPGDASPVDAMNRREAGQAANLHARTFARDPDARVLVYAGRDHVAEAPAGEWTPMGGLLAERAGVDPLTVNLFVMVEHSRPELEHWALRAVEQAGWLADGPLLLVDGAGAFWSANPGSLDAYVFHPRTRLEHGRPDWMAMGGLRSPVAPEVPAADGPLLLQALVEGEAEDAVPLDQALWWPGEPRPALLLRPGAYVVRAVDGEGAVRHRERVRVD